MKSEKLKKQESKVNTGVDSGFFYCGIPGNNSPLISGQIEPVFRWQRQMNLVTGVDISLKDGKELLFLMQRVHLQDEAR